MIRIMIITISIKKTTPPITIMILYLKGEDDHDEVQG